MQEPERITIAIQEQPSKDLVFYRDVSVVDTQIKTLDIYFDHYLTTILPHCDPGEKREYLVFFKDGSHRPSCLKVTFINREQVWERSVMGSSEPPATGSFPFQVDFGTPFTSMKGCFPAPPGSVPAFILDDDGVDEAAVVAAMKMTYQRIIDAIADDFQAETRHSLLSQLKILMQTTGAPGMLPRSETTPDTPIEGSALLMFDTALTLLIEAGHSGDIHTEILSDHEERLHSYNGYQYDVIRSSNAFKKGLPRRRRDSLEAPADRS